MTTGLDLTQKRTRESASKVRTGCTTCKARRVKCDEAKPTCQRCAKGGRSCEYKTACAASRARDVITVYLPPAQSQPVLFVNDRGLDFFHHNLAAKLEGQFYSQFWRSLVLQLSYSEPSIRHAVSAISVIYQDVESSLRHPAGYVDANPEAQRQWNTAVRSLSDRIGALPNESLVPLVCCLLFTCIEFLRGNVESSLLHAESGLNILATTLRRSRDAACDSAKIRRFNYTQIIEDEIVPMFSRLNILCSLAGRITPPIYPSTIEQDSPQKDLADSRRRLVAISDTSIRFIGQASLKAAAFQITIDDLVEQAKLQTSLDAWREQLTNLIKQTQATGKPVHENASSLLLVHYKVIYIWLRVCTTAEETASDAHAADFEELLHYAAQVVQPGNLGSMNAEPQPLSFDMHILGPLYYTALKCRHPLLRRRALELLQFAPRREGVWNAHHAYVTAKRVIALEESHLDERGLPVEAARLHSLPLPDDESRVYSKGEMAFDDLSKLEHGVVLSPACSGTLQFVFRTKPWGLLGGWRTTTEYIRA
ncbi:hypothetical protein BJX64DRAFT_59033 [Aspergillus heterothallicus]